MPSAEATIARAAEATATIARAKTNLAPAAGAPSPTGDSELRTAHAMIRDKVNAKSRQIRKSFRSMDEDHSGLLTKQEVKEGLEILGIKSKCVGFMPLVRPTHLKRLAPVAGKRSRRVVSIKWAKYVER
jgi:hypothetical protein